MSIYVPDEEKEGEQCRVYYKKTSDTSYKRGADAVYQSSSKRWAAAAVGLDEGSEYEVLCIMMKNGEAYGRGTSSALTKTSALPVSESLNLRDIFKEGETLSLKECSGTASGYTRIYADKSFVADGKTAECTIKADGASFIILDGLTLKGGRISCVNLDGSSNIVIRNCDISKWGRVGKLVEAADKPEGLKIQYRDESVPDTAPEDERYINYDAGIRMIGSSDITVEGCFIHEPNGDSTPWAGSEGGITWTRSHPVGCCGMYVKGERLVVRYNDIIGSNTHRFNDCIEGQGNFNLDGGFAKDCDIYGNYLSYAQDDATELDGRAENLRFFGNRINACRTGISAIAQRIGPTYIFNNLMHDFRDTSGRYEFAFKIGQDASSWGTGGAVHIYANTVYPSSSEDLQGINLLGSANITTRNNIIAGLGSNSYQLRDANNESGTLNFDYDMLGSIVGSSNAPKLSLANAAEKEEHAIFGLPVFKSRGETGVFKLAGSSKGLKSSAVVNGFCDGGEEMGAYSGGIDILPLRPISERCDKEYIKLTPGGSAEITLSSESLAARSFKVLKNDTETSLITVSADKLSVSSGENAVITVRAADSFDFSTQYGDEHIIIRFDNGYSLPVGIKLIKQ